MKMKFLLVSTILLTLVIFPAMAFANHGGIVPPCSPDPAGTKDQSGEVIKICTFNDIFNSENGLIKHIIDFVLFYIIIPIATISIAVAGFKMIIQSDKEKARTEAKEILIAVFIGLFVAFASWLIVKVILTTLVDESKFTPPVTYITQIYEA